MITKTIKFIPAILLLLELYTSTIKQDLLLLILFPAAIYFSLEALFNRRYIFSFAYIIISFVYNSICPVTSQPESWILINSATSIVFIVDIFSWCISELGKNNHNSNTVAFETKLKQGVNEALTSQTNKTIENEIQNYFSNQSLEDVVKERLSLKVYPIKDIIKDEITNAISDYSSAEKLEELGFEKLQNTRETLKALIKTLIDDLISEEMSTFTSQKSLERAVSLANNEYSDTLNKAVELSMEQYIDKSFKVFTQDLSKDDIKINNLELVSEKINNILKEHINECLINVQVEEFTNEHMGSITTRTKEYVSKQVKEIVNKEVAKLNNENIFGDLSKNRLIKEGYNLPSKEIREMICKSLSFSSANEPNKAEELIRKALLIWGREEELSTTCDNLTSVTTEKSLKYDLKTLDNLFPIDLETATKVRHSSTPPTPQNNSSCTAAEPKKQLATTFIWPPKKNS